MQAIKQAIKKARKLRNPIHNPTPEQMNETKKEEPVNPKCVYAQYNITQKFKIPKGIDLDDKKQVSDWGVKWSTLRISLTNGEQIMVDPSNSDEMKHPDEEKVEEDSDDEEEEEQEGQNCRRCQTFVPDGEECVLEGDHNAYCETCFKEVEEEEEEE